MGTQLPHWHIKLSASFRKDIKMWVDFLEHWNGVSIFLDSHISQPRDLQRFTDASGSLGYVGFLDGLWFQGHWLPEHTLNKKRGISIEWQELFPIYLACVLWGPTWSGKRILIWCDNQSVVAIINSKHTKSPQTMDLVCSITLLTLTNSFTISTTYIPGLDNAIADSLSHFQMDRFWALAPTASLTPCVIPSSAMLI